MGGLCSHLSHLPVRMESCKGFHLFSHCLPILGTDLTPSKHTGPEKAKPGTKSDVGSEFHSISGRLLGYRDAAPGHCLRAGASTVLSVDVG